MLRKLHKIPGLLAAVLIVILTLSGAALSLMPALEKAQAPVQAEAGLSVADLASRVAAVFPGVEQIRRAPSGEVTAFYFADDRPGAVVIDPATGQALRDYAPSAVVRWLTNLHRALLLGDGGRLAAAAGALALVVLSLSGLSLTARRAGGWRRIFSRLRGPLMGRLHVEIARVAVSGLLLSSVTALFMTASTFDLLPQQAALAGVPAAVSGQTGVSLDSVALLNDTPLRDLRELTFPYPDDASDVFTLKTNAGEGYLDQGTGAVLEWVSPGPWQNLTETIYMLHTGQGAWGLGLILGLMALGAPVMAATGATLWWTSRKARPRIRHNVAAARADTVILVGSEGGSTWGFAATLSAGLTAAGHHVHVSAMSRFAPERYTRARQVIVMAATYGDGTAPGSARGFLDRLAAQKAAPDMALAVLGFGDRKFPAYCAFAHQVETAARAKGWAALVPMDTVDRQSSQDFARWGRVLGQALGLDLELEYQPVLPRTHALTLISRRDYGAEMQTPTAILRFALPPSGWWARLRGGKVQRFAAGDLLGIVPEGSTVPRFYSLASGLRDGFVEICVRKHHGGLCSGQLMGLNLGDSVQGFIRGNPDFRPARSRKPVILIGAGTGIGPLAGFARANRPGRAMHLYFGARHPDSDLLYGCELSDWQADGRLSTVETAFSRTGSKAYVQDILRKDAARIVRLIEDGAQILVCGGRDMAAGIGLALTDILAPVGMTPAMMKAEGRYAEDIY